jgi:putative membrane protein insertion efficiency factor
MKLARLPLIGLIRAYQLLVSPFMAPSCRYLPSCSAYASEALERHGVIVGGWLALKRVARCHPWGGMGYDPVPEAAGDDHVRAAREGRFQTW